VIAADRPLLGQLAPGDAVRFAVVDAATALDAARRSREAFAEALAHLEDADRWDDLWRHAGA
jgi:allophanate hydrolase subunit 2